MAEVTRNRNDVQNYEGAVCVIYGDVDIAANNDTWKHGLRSVISYGNSKPGSVTAMTGTGDTATFTTGGAVADVMVWAAGYV